MIEWRTNKCLTLQYFWFRKKKKGIMACLQFIDGHRFALAIKKPVSKVNNGKTYTDGQSAGYSYKAKTSNQFVVV